jgi:hypothetical protein
MCFTEVLLCFSNNYIVDIWLSIEMHRLQYYYFNQKKLRCDLYDTKIDRPPSVAWGSRRVNNRPTHCASRFVSHRCAQHANVLSGLHGHCADFRQARIFHPFHR